ncbi:hypothetical protein N9M83_04775 [Candidatus Poseidonia alphae]|nr:hypothetical protein [Candidatus Poseidonia alphae]MDA8531189.1 hypothetical protein [Candidatus Poseidonia alphae]MDA8638538.1 hypothetical protein [Candidatus Poseidonia alphae]MDA8749854.1 hypothetical protein [Candidatus Poseidonia alphae]MDA8759528.1 hypothetical protein [Candidatus Poseidonia alphae]
MLKNDLSQRDGAQMLLATGVVLLMSLLSMAIFGVKVAGLTIPHDAASDDVIVTSEEVMESLQPLSQARTDMWIEGGLEGVEAADLALETVHDDLLHHGELRGVEVKLTNIIISVIDSSQLSVTAQLGVSDGEAMLSADIAFVLDV